MVSKYWKAITALIVGVLGWVGIVLASAESSVTNAEWGQLVTVLVAALGVFLVPNSTGAAPE